jgi:uncharacterized protein (DUF58 family)
VAASGNNDYRKYLDPAVVSRLSSLELKTRYIVEGFLLGLHRSPYHGFSIEFSQHRPYMQGDSPKDIDWRAYGKTDKFYIKEYEEETNLRCSVLLDCSRSMAFSHAGRISKFDYAAMLASAFSYLCIHQKDAAGLTLYADTIKKYLPPKASSGYLNEILKAISTASVSDGTMTAKCLAESAEKINHKGLVIVLSDFFDDPAEIMKGLKHFRFKKNEVIVFQILDPVERSFAFGTDAIFVDMEGDDEIVTQPHQIQKAYQESMKEYLATMKKECLQNGIDYNLIDTSELFDKSLFSYLQKRSRLY